MAREKITITEIANMKDRVTFQVPTYVSDGQGGQETTWVDIPETPTVWCYLKPVSSRERYFAEQIEYQRSHTALIRYREDITQEMRVLWKGRIFQVKGAYDPDHRRAYLRIDLEENQGT